MFSVIQWGSDTSYLDTSTLTCGTRIRHPYLFFVRLPGRCDLQQYV
jgi:hypothetical protein